MKKISIRDLKDARYIGPGRAEELMQELISLFENQSLTKDLDSAENAMANVISNVSPKILGKLLVEEDLYKYHLRICSVEVMSNERRNSILNELFPTKNSVQQELFRTKNSVQGVLFESRNHENSVGHLIDVNLRPSFAIAKFYAKITIYGLELSQETWECLQELLHSLVSRVVIL